ncbi:MAG: UvrD-helicase domain-containing protein [Leptospiraceae bacterium]|nr:UvrD-helicase domain-containing protein [Leptospiraceae bacterium]
MEYSEEQKEILNETSNFVQVVAAAGSGKTSTMVALLEKIVKENSENQSEILVITFTRKATAEIKERLEKRISTNRIRIHTFHAYSLSVLERFHPRFQNSKTKIVEPNEKEKICREFLQQQRFKVGGIPYEFLLKEEDSILEKIFPELHQEMLQNYIQWKLKENKLDFSDLVKFYLEGLETDESWAIKARQEIKRVIVDEFQDTDFEQLKWLQLLSPEKLTVVGDDWQAIYGFRGATTEPFLNFRKFFPETKIHFLTTNYRSLKKIIECSSIPISKNKMNIQKTVKPFRKGNGNVFRMEIKKNSEFKIFFKLISMKADFRILCRSNYRIFELQKLGFPKENLLTIHSSKGLEFSTVIVDLTDGWNSGQEKKDSDIQEEERRILYVALSRAKNNLIIVTNEKLFPGRLESLFASYFRKLNLLENESLVASLD